MDWALLIRPEPRLHPDFNGTLKIDVPIATAGAFAFYTTYRPLPDFSSILSAEASPQTQSPLYYVDVSPKVILRGLGIPLDALSIFSVVSKFMGKYPTEWNMQLRGIGQRAYNVVHFTPLMERGESNSSYSIYDQLTFDPACFAEGEEDIKRMIAYMEKEHGLLGLTDVVWNHTANNSKWLEEHPDAGYNIETAPWLESALELDTALLDFSDKLEAHGLPTELKSMGDLDRLIDGIKRHLIEPLKLWQYYVIDVKDNAKRIVDAWIDCERNTHEYDKHRSTLVGIDGIKSWSLRRKADFVLDKKVANAEILGPRFARQIDLQQGAAILDAIYGPCDDSRKSEDTAYSFLVDLIDEVNVPFYNEFNEDMSVIAQQLHGRIRYLRLDGDGPRLGLFSKSSTLIETYFTRLPLNATTKKHDPKALSLVNNGWIWAANAMKDHAGRDSRAYLRREVIVWGDCVKLRYGQGPGDSPFLWDFMTKYTRLMAKYFAAFRIDNCHSTPIGVAEYLLDQARLVRPDLVVFAELFTGSEEMDYVFVKRLGLSALIREAMQAWSTQEISRLVHMHGGRPIGSFEVDESSRNDNMSNVSPRSDGSSGSNGVNGIKKGRIEHIHRIRQSPVHALFMDCTHDNELPAQKRDARDTLPNAALVEMCACATGSVMGYDEIYPEHLDVVQERRTYTPIDFDNVDIEDKSIHAGIGGTKRLLNELHTRMGKDGFNETFIHHEGEYITVHRVNPLSRRGVFLAAHTAFPGYGSGNGTLSPVHLTGTRAKLLRCQQLDVDVSQPSKQKAIKDPEFLDGLPSKILDLQGVTVDLGSDETLLSMPPEFPPGSIALFETWIPGAEHSEGLDHFATSGATEAFAHLDLIDLNYLLYRCEAEERDASASNEGVYTIPKHGSLVYAGVQGWWSILKGVIRSNDLGHPICDHLRDGQWALDYIVARLEHLSRRVERPALKTAATWFSARFEAIRKVPSFLLPRYFALVIQAAYQAAWSQGIGLFSQNIQHGQRFLQALAMTSIQMTGHSKSASLSPKSRTACLAAGLPHFSSSWARCWGRDIFISLRGLFLGTGRYEDAREHILAFASVLKHGMIPNLLSDGKMPRYNSRDSIWFFLQSIQDYTKMVPKGISILEEKVQRRFLPYDDTFFEYDDPRAYSKESTIAEIIQEALQRHASGLSFREANAGSNLDMQMRFEGFQIDVHVDWATGFILGGNQFNCGTWMDKMGESEKAGSKGIPGTPRDGAAIEITGLLYSTLKWVSELHAQGAYQPSGVTNSDGQAVTFQDWKGRILRNFERCYFVPVDPSRDGNYDVNPRIINRRGIYKDLYQSGKDYEDYQLRPNFSIAMTVASDLFEPQHALHALRIADDVLRGPTGMATLDPSDLNYRPYYNNSEDSTDFATSKGRNYHQGPEWLWPTGFFLRALLKFDLERRTTEEGRTEAFQQVTRRLMGCKRAIESSPWAGLTELTNKGGEYCKDSVSFLDSFRSQVLDCADFQLKSPTQAWSSGCLIDLFCDAKDDDS